MKRVALVFLLSAGIALAATGLSAITLAPALGDYSFLACAADGGTSQAVVAGNYVMRVTTADTAVCSTAACSTGGQTWPQGTVIYLALPAATMNCRSSTATGNVYLTQAK